MITKDEIELARKAPWLNLPRVDDEGPENSALFLIGLQIEQFAQRTSCDRAISDAVDAYAKVGLDQELAETAINYVKCWG
ncbi:hypothetical protein [Modicisalibacter luteus]|jgi:hypothetical protein|uniref:Uncharacterized protein n=1 Tax=Modicisalibacter luteus TaxID=453962 RepID=A0ABV7LXW3_9GAMM|nr:hypothetical protein [Halomonas lutea]GHB04590.1 hypothetical protein GCM10007159_27870 [Halomonas lutea]